MCSATLGLAKCLKNGVASPIAPGGLLDGLLGGKFLLGFLASGVVLAIRVFCIANANAGRYHSEASLSHIVILLLLFAPQFLLSLFSTLNFRDKSCLKILYRHPSLIVLHTVTFFTFSKTTLSQICFSKKFTWLNAGVSTLGFVSWLVWEYFSLSKEQFYKIVISFIFPIAIPLFLFSILLTALFLHLDKLCCCCCNPREQLSVSDPALDKRFVMVDGEVVEDPWEEYEQRISVNMEGVGVTVALNDDLETITENDNFLTIY